jgi:hypothetical protein
LLSGLGAGFGQGNIVQASQPHMPLLIAIGLSEYPRSPDRFIGPDGNLQTQIAAVRMQSFRQRFEL